MPRIIPYGRQDINEADIQAVIETLRSDWLTQGPAIELFEKRVAEYCGVEYAVAVCNATAALHIACLGLDLGPGDLLWTSPNTFVASANCGRYCGAEVDFVDIDPVTYNLSITELERKLASAKKQNRLPKVVVPVHFSGQSCEMARIAELAREYHFKVLEDASHAIGGSYRGEKVGACGFSDAAVFSFHPVKIVTTGEGGMILTRDRKTYERLLRLRSHGITRDAKLMKNGSHGAWYYEQVDLGYNYRMTDIQAALGSSQMTRIDSFVSNRSERVKRYNTALKDLPLALPTEQPDCVSAHHLYVIRLLLDKISKTHRQVFDELRAQDIGVNLHYIPVHLQPYYEALGFKSGAFPSAEKYYGEVISIPLYSSLTHEDQDRVIAALRSVLT